MTRRVLALLATGALALGAAPARAYVPDKTPKRHLEAAIRRTMTLPPVRPTVPGIMVLRAGRPVLQINVDRPFLPASLLKLVTIIHSTGKTKMNTATQVSTVTR